MSRDPRYVDVTMPPYNIRMDLPLNDQLPALHRALRELGELGLIAWFPPNAAKSGQGG